MALTTMAFTVVWYVIFVAAGAVLVALAKIAARADQRMAYLAGRPNHADHEQMHALQRRQSARRAPGPPSALGR